MVPLPVDAAVPSSRPGMTAVFVGVATVREAAVAIDADFCILMDASASISVRDIAGLDDEERSRCGRETSGLAREPRSPPRCGRRARRHVSASR